MLNAFGGKVNRFKKKPYYPLLLLSAICCVLQTSTSVAQNKTTNLQEVKILANKMNGFGVGTTITKIDSALIQRSNQISLAHLLNIQSPAYIKQYGAQMLSTISFRGTGASHTLVLWNGMQVGYPFLGQTDLSLVSLDFVDQITLVHGSSSARFGTGAIGGIINLQSHNKSHNGTSVAINQSVGSFKTTNSSLHLAKFGKKGSVKIKGYYKQSLNNFPYKSSSGEKLGTQKNAGFSMWGAQFSSQYYVNKLNLLTLQVQITRADRNLQPSIGSLASSNQKDKNIWSFIEFKHLLKKGLIEAKYGFLLDAINYEKSITTSNQHKIAILGKYDIFSNLSIEVGCNTTLVNVKTPFYNNSIGQENRSNLFASALWLPINRLNISFNLRQAFVTNYTIPFTPSIGIRVDIFKYHKWHLNIKGQLAKGYKVPTLNDRFWVPGGNLNLLPEKSTNIEAGFELINKTNNPFWLNGTVYQLWVNNWILWLPNGIIWGAQNKRSVKGFGIEIETGGEKNLGNSILKGWINYAYTKSTNQEPLDKYDRSVGKQLPYVPFHNGNVTVQLNVGKWQFQANAVATGKRFITADNETELPHHAFLNVQTSYQIILNRWHTQFYLYANNITNSNYQSIINKAMPGINFLAGIKINFN